MIDQLIESLRPIVQQLPQQSQSARVIVVGASSEAKHVAIDLGTEGGRATVAPSPSHFSISAWS